MTKNHKTDLFEVNAFEVVEEQKAFPSVHVVIKYNDKIIHEEIHTTKSNAHAKYLVTERLEACMSPKVLAFILIRYGLKNENTHLITSGREYLESAI